MTKKLLGILVAAAMLLSIVPAVLAQSAPARDGAASAIWDFETDPANDGWTFVDEDGDGYNWTWAEDTAAGAPIAASGTKALRSFSYYSGPGALTPDNWAITPAVELPEGQATLSYYIASYSGNYPETYRVYVFAGESDEPISVTDDLVSPDSMREFEERTVDLSEFAGQSVKVAFRHYNCSNQFRVYIDDVSILASGESENPVEPPAEPELIFGSYFEEDHDPADEGWQFVDADGDGHTWTWHATSAGAAYEGSGILGSHSYNYGWGGELHPDNWAVSPAIELPAEELSVTFYARGYDSYFPVERFEVYAGTSADIEEMSEVLTVSATTASWTQYTADLTDFANETVYIAIRHCTESGGDSLIVDQFEVWGSESEDPIEPTVPPTEAPVEPTETPVEPTEAPAADEPIFGSYFEAENDPAEEGWQFVDSDGDGKNWQWKPNTFGVAYEGSGIIASYSYIYPPGNVNPDNWAISPAIELPAENLSVTFYAKGYLANYCSEHFAVYAGTSSDLSDLTEVLAETVTTGSYVQYTADLSDFANETVYIAIRHFNTNPGEEAICVDQFEVWGSEGETPVEPEIIGDVNGDGEATIADALLALRYVMELEELTEEQLAQADVDGDGEVTMIDCLLIQRYAMGVIESFPVENP